MMRGGWAVLCGVISMLMFIFIVWGSYVLLPYGLTVYSNFLRLMG